jgi:hypothetical protein
MSLKCILGLIACLNFHGNKVPLPDAESVLDLCDQIKATPVSYFDIDNGDVRGSATVSLARDYGLEYDWPKDLSPSGRKRAAMNACRDFKRLYHTDSAWDNLDKWPY